MNGLIEGNPSLPSSWDHSARSPPLAPFKKRVWALAQTRFVVALKPFAYCSDIAS